MRFATFDRIISPEVGARIAGYGIDQFSVCKADDLHAVGLLADDGARRVLIVAFDLLGLDRSYIRQLRQKCADILGIPFACVMFSCTHTHSGPESRTLGKLVEKLNTAFLEKLDATVCDAVSNFGDCLAFTTRDAVRFLQTAADAMFDLRDSLFPEDAAKDEPFPDFVVRPLVDIPKN